MNMLEKDLERQGNEKEAQNSLKTIVSFCFALLLCLRYVYRIVIFFLEPDTEDRYWSFMEAHPAHNSHLLCLKPTMDTEKKVMKFSLMTQPSHV